MCECSFTTRKNAQWTMNIHECSNEHSHFNVNNEQCHIHNFLWMFTIFLWTFTIFCEHSQFFCECSQFFVNVHNFLWTLNCDCSQKNVNIHKKLWMFTKIVNIQQKIVIVHKSFTKIPRFFGEKKSGAFWLFMNVHEYSWMSFIWKMNNDFLNE